VKFKNLSTKNYLPNFFPVAHCLENPLNWEVSCVRIGKWDLNKETDCNEDGDLCAPEPIDIKVVGTIPHPNYVQKSASKHHDIAFLRLAKQIKFNDFVKPICLPLDPVLWEKDYRGYTFEVAGFGRIKRNLKNFT
jgi:hypothetical protein